MIPCGSVRRVAGLLPVWTSLALALAGGCTDTKGSPSSEGAALGSIQIGLQVPPSLEIDTVSYQISNGTISRAGTLDVSKSSTITAVVGGLPAGNGYQVTLSATDVAHKFSSCAGSAMFNVSANAVTPVPIQVDCHLAPVTTPPPPSVPIPYPAVALLAGALLGAGLMRSGSRR